MLGQSHVNSPQHYIPHGVSLRHMSGYGTTRAARRLAALVPWLDRSAFVPDASLCKENDAREQLRASVCPLRASMLLSFSLSKREHRKEDRGEDAYPGGGEEPARDGCRGDDHPRDERPRRMADVHDRAERPE